MNNKEMVHFFISQIKTHLTNTNTLELEHRFKLFIEPLSVIASDFPRLSDSMINITDFYERFSNFFFIFWQF